jgi:hypothetical protein
MGEKWSKERRLKIQFDRLEKKIQPYSIFLYRIIKLIRENPEAKLESFFKEDVLNDLILLDKIALELGIDIYHYKDEVEVEEEE